MDLSNRIKRNEDIAYRVIDEEALLVNPKDNTLYTLNDVAARIWELLDGKKPAQEIADIIDEEFEGNKASLKEDLMDFLETLRNKNLAVGTA